MFLNQSKRKCQVRHPRELENHSMAEIGRDPWRSSCPLLVFGSLCRGPEVCPAVHKIHVGDTGRALKLCKLNQGTMVSTWQKAIASELCTHHNQCSFPDRALGGIQWYLSSCKVWPTLTPAQGASSEHTTGKYAQRNSSAYWQSFGKRWADWVTGSVTVRQNTGISP